MLIKKVCVERGRVCNEKIHAYHLLHYQRVLMRWPEPFSSLRTQMRHHRPRLDTHQRHPQDGFLVAHSGAPIHEQRPPGPVDEGQQVLCSGGSREHHVVAWWVLGD